jgi:hypothetical protein
VWDMVRSKRVVGTFTEMNGRRTPGLAILRTVEVSVDRVPSEEDTTSEIS